MAAISTAVYCKLVAPSANLDLSLWLEKHNLTPPQSTAASHEKCREMQLLSHFWSLQRVMLLEQGCWQEASCLVAFFANLCFGAEIG